MPSGKYRLSDDGKYAVELISYTPAPVVSGAGSMLGGVAPKSPPPQLTLYTQAELLFNGENLDGASQLTYYRASDAAWVDERFSGIASSNCVTDPRGNIKVWVIKVADADNATNGVVGLDGTLDWYYRYNGTWSKVQTKAEKKAEEEAWLAERLVPVWTAITQLRADMVAGFAQAAAARNLLSNRITANSNLIDGLTGRLNSTDSLLSTTIGRTVTLENNANSQADVLENHEARILHIEGTAVNGHSISSDSTGAVTWSYVGTDPNPIIDSTPIRVNVGGGGTGGGGTNPTTPMPGDYLASGHTILNRLRNSSGEYTGGYVISATTGTPPANAAIWEWSDISAVRVLDQYANVISSINSTTGQVTYGNSLPAIVGNYTRTGGHEVLGQGSDGKLHLSRFNTSNLQGKVGDALVIGATLEGSSLIVISVTGTNLVFGNP